MCLTTATLAAFLTMIAGAPMTTEPGRIIIHATDRDTHWVATDGTDEWCTTAPQQDGVARIKTP